MKHLQHFENLNEQKRSNYDTIVSNQDELGNSDTFKICLKGNVIIIEMN